MSTHTNDNHSDEHNHEHNDDVVIFALHPRLAEDTYAVAETADYYLRLHKNALVPWLILVPKTQHTELFACESALKQRLREVVDDLAAFSKDYFQADKMNIASIGNVVSQLHIHIIARYRDDFVFPDTVWGQSAFLAYETAKKDAIITALNDFLKRQSVI